MEEDSRLKLRGFIMDFSFWDDTINHFVMKFHDRYNVYPNILLASDDTYKKIDLYAQKHPDRIIKFDEAGNLETIETSEDSYDGLSMFTAEEYELECCIDYVMKNRILAASLLLKRKLKCREGSMFSKKLLKWIF